MCLMVLFMFYQWNMSYKTVHFFIWSVFPPKCFNPQWFLIYNIFFPFRLSVRWCIVFYGVKKIAIEIQLGTLIKTQQIQTECDCAATGGIQQKNPLWKHFHKQCSKLSSFWQLGTKFIWLCSAGARKKNSTFE